MPNSESQKKILIVDDEKIIVDILTRRFNRMGFSVSTALDGVEAAQKIKNEEIDLVICDVLLPNGISGEKVLAEAKRQRPNSRFVAISGNVMSDKSVQKLMDSGADLFIKKPFPSLGEATQQMAALLQELS